MKIQNGLEGVGAALLLFPYYLPFFHPQNHELYHHGLPVGNLVGGLLVDLFGCAILLTGFLISTERFPTRIKRIAGAMFSGLMLWSIVRFAIEMLILLQYPIESWGRIWELSAIAIPLISGVMAVFLPRFASMGVRMVRITLTAFSFSALWIVPHLIHLALARQPVRTAASIVSPAAAGSISNRRIIWILFDELSYDQAFDHVAPGIQLPNLNRLRSSSVTFSNLQADGYRTDRIIPSLLLGRHIEQFRSTTTGELSYWDESGRRWIDYDPSATLFGLAERNGWNTGIDGWYNPYCEILAPVLNVCFTDPGIVLVPMEDYGASEDKAVLANAAILPDDFLAALIHPKRVTLEEHMQAYLAIMMHARGQIRDNRLSFVLLHIPIPHPPGIYDRHRHVLRAGGNYLDNLVLADDTLGMLIREIDASPSASQTTLIVTSDHSWRTPMWRQDQGWSAEEEQVSGGQFDSRPVLLAHFPQQASGQEVTALLPEMLEHDMIAGMLLGQIKNANDLDVFLSHLDH